MAALEHGVHGMCINPVYIQYTNQPQPVLMWWLICASFDIQMFEITRLMIHNEHFKNSRILKANDLFLYYVV